MYDMTSVREQTALRYFDFSDDQRLRFSQTINDKPLNDRARKFLRLSFDATCEHSKPGLRVRYYDRTLIISCPQERLAELLDGCSVKTVQRMLEELEAVGVLEKRKTVPKTDGAPVQKTVYLVFLDRLEELPSLDPTDELDSVILDSDGDLRGSGRRSAHPETDVVCPVVCPVVSDVARDVVCPVVSVVASDVVSLMNHDHEGLNEIINSSITHDQESHDAREPERRARFDDISDRDIRGIAGFSVEINGRTGTASEASRLKKLREYFDDAVQAGLADPGDFRLFAALFRCVGRRTDVKFRPRYLRTLWTNRNEKPLEGVVTTADREYVRRLLESAQLVPH
jgi:hypothetical protein